MPTLGTPAPFGTVGAEPWVPMVLPPTAGLSCCGGSSGSGALGLCPLGHQEVGSAWHPPALERCHLMVPPHVPSVSHPCWGPLASGWLCWGIWGGRREDEEGWQSLLTPCIPQLGPGVPQRGEQRAGCATGVSRLCPVLCCVCPHRVLLPQGWDQPSLGLRGGGGRSLGGAVPCHQSDGAKDAPWLGLNTASPTPPALGTPEGCLPISGCHVSPIPVSPWVTRYDMESAENGSPGSDKGKGLERSLEDLSKSSSSSPTQGSSKVRHLTVR